MRTQLSKIGIYFDEAGRQIMNEFFNNTLNVNLSEIINTTEIITVNIFLAGFGVFLSVKSVWEGAKLITFIFFS